MSGDFHPLVALSPVPTRFEAGWAPKLTAKILHSKDVFNVALLKGMRRNFLIKITVFCDVAQSFILKGSNLQSTPW
jgi:hypothetical protein